MSHLLFIALLAFPIPVQDATPAADRARLIEEGSAQLLAMQEARDGKGEPAEWPYEGVYRVKGEIPMGYHVGGTAACALALLQTPGYAADGELREAVHRATRFVLDGLEHSRMAAGFEGGYDVRGWGHTYALTLLLRLRALQAVPEDWRDEVDRRVEWLIHALESTEIEGSGGWNYARRTRGGGTSPASPFMTAPTILALWEARAQGAQVDGAVIERALTVLQGARNEHGAIPYNTSARKDEMPGAIGRTPVTEVVLLMAGRSDPERLSTSIDAFFEYWPELEARRSKRGTHEGPYSIAPYYFWYAHRYLALAIEFLPEAERPRPRRLLLERMLEVRQEDGRWNDRVFPRTANYGTAMVVLALLEPELQRPRIGERTGERTGEKAAK